MRIPSRVLGAEPDFLEQLAHARVGRAPSARLWIVSPSRTIAPMDMRGLSEENGSWKTICI